LKSLHKNFHNFWTYKQFYTKFQNKPILNQKGKRKTNSFLEFTRTGPTSGPAARARTHSSLSLSLLQQRVTPAAVALTDGELPDDTVYTNNFDSLSRTRWCHFGQL
jgi:hypothetical protein